MENHWPYPIFGTKKRVLNELLKQHSDIGPKRVGVWMDGRLLDGFESGHLTKTGLQIAKLLRLSRLGRRDGD